MARMDTTTTLPLAPIFLSHGSPMTALEPGEVGPFWRRLGASFDAGSRPRAILAVSGPKPDLASPWDFRAFAQGKAGREQSRSPDRRK